MDVIQFALCKGNGESIDKPRLIKLAADLLPLLQEKATRVNGYFTLLFARDDHVLGFL